MTPELERAAKIAFQAQCDVLGLPFDQTAADNTPTTDGLRAALRALENPSPETLVKMAKAISDKDLRIHVKVAVDMALASWRAGLIAILGKEPLP